MPDTFPAGTDIDDPALLASPAFTDTRAWLEQAVIGLNLCPFAKAVYKKRQIRYRISDARDTPDCPAAPDPPSSNHTASSASARPAIFIVPRGSPSTTTASAAVNVKFSRNIGAFTLTAPSRRLREKL